MELRHLRYFVALAEELHFGRAAARLRLAQPSLSRQIRQLEDEISADLLDRTDPRHVTLTAAGMQFLEGARQTLALAERTLHDARRAADAESGRLAIAFVPSILQAPEAGAILRHFREAQGEVRVEVTSLRTLEQWEALRSGRVQIGFCYHPPDDAEIRGDPLWQQRILLAVPAHHPLASVPVISLEMVAREPFIWFDRALSPPYHDLVRKLFESRGLSIEVAQEATTESARLSLVAGGLGVTLVPGGWGAHPPVGVRMRSVTGLEESMQVWAIYDANRLSRAGDAFLSGVRRVLRGASMLDGSRKAS